MCVMNIVKDNAGLNPTSPQDTCSWWPKCGINQIDQKYKINTMLFHCIIFLPHIAIKLYHDAQVTLIKEKIDKTFFRDSLKIV